MNKTRFYRILKWYIRRWSKHNQLFRVLKSISREKYAERISGSIIYGLLSSIAVNLFYQSGGVYASGITGIAQILSSLSYNLFGFALPISLIFYAINFPLLVISWYKIGHKFTVFTFITVTFSSLFIQFIPRLVLVEEPVMNAIFGGLILGTGIGYALRNNVSSGGVDIISLLIQKKTGQRVGGISLVVNLLIMLAAGLIFGWEYALYSMVSIFVSSQMTDVVYVKQKRMQATIITSKPERVVKMIQKKLHRGVTIINGAEGGYNHDEKAVLITIITRAELNNFKYYMKKADAKAFISIADNVHIIGRFVENE